MRLVGRCVTFPKPPTQIILQTTDIHVYYPFQVRDLEAELEAEQRRHREASAAARKFERQLKELMVQSDEDRRMITDLTEQVAMLTQKIKVYKRQVEEAVSFIRCHNVTYCLPSATVLCECAGLDNHCIFLNVDMAHFNVYWQV